MNMATITRRKILKNYENNSFYNTSIFKHFSFKFLIHVDAAKEVLTASILNSFGLKGLPECWWHLKMLAARDRVKHIST
jgi:hypothetical protein